MSGPVRSLYLRPQLVQLYAELDIECHWSRTPHKGKGISMKRLKGRVVQMALWLATIMAIVLASGAPNRL
jgi:hypothetical protein